MGSALRRGRYGCLAAGIAALERLDDEAHPGTERTLHHDGVTRTDGGEHVRLEESGRLGIAAATPGRKSLPQILHERAAAKHQIHAMVENRFEHLAMQLRTARSELQHVAEAR